MMAKTLDLGQVEFERGHFENAVKYWRKTLLNLSPKNSPADYLDTSVRLAGAYQRLGHLQNALEVLHCAEAYAEPRKDEDAHRYAKILSRLGSVYLAACDNNCKQNQTHFQKLVCPHKMPQPKQCNGTSKMDKANCYLNKANEHASNNLLKASILNELGNLSVKKKEFDKALSTYLDSKTLAEKEAHHVLKSKVLLNMVQASIQAQNYEDAKRELKNVSSEIKGLPNSYDKAFALMSIVDLDMNMADLEKNLPSLPLHDRYDLIQNAFEIAKTLENKRAMAYALFYKAQLYAEKQRYKEAIKLTQQAIIYAQNYPAELHIRFWSDPDLLFKLQWQLGKYLKAQQFDKHQIAIEKAYEQADKHLKLVPLAYGHLSPNFLSEAKEFYFDWADFLFKKVTDKKLDENKKRKLLKKAQEVVESFGIAQVQEYYFDECITQELEEQGEHLYDNLPNQVAIFYPLLFEDRIVSLVVTNKGVEQSIYDYPNDEDNDIKNIKDVKQIINNFINVSKNNTCDITINKKIYKWFQAAFEKLEKQKIKTIALVQNDIWASVPFSAIYNDEKEEFLVQKFAFFVTPSIKLTDSRLFSSDNNNQRTLIGGLSRTTDDKKHLRLCYVPSEVVGVAGELFGIESNDEIVRSQLNNCKEKQSQQYQGVDAESLITSKEEQLDILLDQEFNPSKLKAKFFDEDKGNYSIVHFATHSEFSYVPSNSYILVAGKEIKIDELRSLIKKNKKFGKQPEDLLVLSSCESAKGEEGKNLGLATVAIKAGIPSVLATLWSIDDKETKNLIVEFYNQLRQEKNKAEALKEAQTKSLLKSGKKAEKLCGSGNDKYNKPRYWAPFILIGNGLTKIKF